MGVVALTCAAIDDVTAWCLLALVVSIAQERTSDAVRTVLLTAALIFVVLKIVAPFVRPQCATPRSIRRLVASGAERRAAGDAGLRDDDRSTSAFTDSSGHFSSGPSSLTKVAWQRS